MKDILYFDTIAGLSGDMVLGALLDLGVKEEYLKNELAKLNVSGFELKITRRQKSGITGTDFKVQLKPSVENNRPEHDHDQQTEKHSNQYQSESDHIQAHDHNHSHENDHQQDHNHNSEHSPTHKHQHQAEHEHGHQHQHQRNLNDIEKIINDSDLNNFVKELSMKMFKKIAVAEAKVHDKELEEIHFHEVGALDSIIDLVGTAICIDQLAPEKIYISPLPLGTGFVKCDHGQMPVPAPATVEILQGIPVYSRGIESELVTPTGAAIAVTLADEFRQLPDSKIKATGYGLADKDLEIPNLLRVFILEEDSKKKMS
ncbi:MAG: nickel insertion protein [Bacillota bacterium]